jgi:ribosomal protein L37AE/L43A
VVDMNCPNPSCGRAMRLCNFDYSAANHKSRYCKYCGRGSVKDVGEVAFWKCDNCGAEVSEAADANLRAIAKGAAPKLDQGGLR